MRVIGSIPASKTHNVFAAESVLMTNLFLSQMCLNLPYYLTDRSKNKLFEYKVVTNRQSSEETKVNFGIPQFRSVLGRDPNNKGIGPGVSQ